MPTLSEQEIREKVADGGISAITIDTNIFDKYGCNLDFKVFRSLDQFAGKQIDVLFSEIVMREVKNHIADEAAETVRELKKALASQGKRWKIAGADMAPSAAYRLDAPATVAADEQFEDFRNAVAAEIVPALGANDRTAEILDLYFSVTKPFENKDAKKNEFPDAFALLSLEAHARRLGTMILCVSNDKGWASYCKDSAELVCLDDLTKAMSFFNTTGRNTAEDATNLIRAAETNELTAQIEGAIESRVAYSEFHADGWSSVSFETYPESSTLNEVDWGSATAPAVISADEESVTFTTKITASVHFEASFHFEVRDGIDRDYVSLGSETVEKDADVDFEVVVTISRQLLEDLDSLDVEVASRSVTVDFGSVEPFQSENPYDEDY